MKTLSRQEVTSAMPGELTSEMRKLIEQIEAWPSVSHTQAPRKPRPSIIATEIVVDGDDGARDNNNHRSTAAALSAGRARWTTSLRALDKHPLSTMVSAVPQRLDHNRLSAVGPTIGPGRRCCHGAPAALAQQALAAVRGEDDALAAAVRRRARQLWKLLRPTREAHLAAASRARRPGAPSHTAQ